MKSVQKNYLLIVILLILPINSWAEAIGDKDGYLKPVSNTQLEKQIKDRLLKKVKIINPRPYRGGFSQQMLSQQYVESAVPVAAMLVPSFTRQNEAVAAASPNSAGASSTNVQERGVDELDLIKTDGRFLYAVNNYGSSDYYGGNSKPSGIRIYDTKTNSVQPKQIGTIGFAKGIVISGMYLMSKKQQLLLIGNSYSKQHTLRKINPYGGNTTHIIRIDIRNKRKPRIMQYVKIEGRSTTTRRINNQLYLVLSTSSFLPRTQKYIQTKTPISKEKRAQYKKEIINKIQKWKVQDILPKYQVLGKTGIKTLIKTGQFLLDPEESTRHGMTTLLSIDLMAKDFQFDTLNYLGTSNTVYVSRKALYIPNHQYTGLKSLDSQRFPKTLPHMIIHKFSFKGKGFDYRGSGVVLGTLGGAADSFKLDEDRRGNLRVVTNNFNWRKTHFSDPAANSPVVLTALAEHTRNKQLITLSRLPNHKHPKALGKTGERLYGARLFNDYAYFVTFLNTDPLYVVDMRNPYNMRVTGELIIPGFSSYLHPISKNLLLGVGKEAKEQRGKNWALFQGVKLSLFDISNPNLPREVQKMEIGKRGTSSPVVNGNHHAFTSLVMPNSPITRIAIPINLITKENDYKNSEQGLHQFEVNTQTRKIEAVGKLIPPRKKQKHWSWNGSDRSIIINDKLYYYSDGRFWAGKWQ